MPSPFEVLDVEPGADEAEIDRAYRRAVKRTHPDQGGSIEAFQRVQAAYDALLENHFQPADLDERDGDEGINNPPTEVEYVDYRAVADRGWDLAAPNLFDRIRDADQAEADHGRVTVDRDVALLDAVEEKGLTWPYSCRGGACANCAVKVLEGELSQPVNHILPDAAVARDIRLSCVGKPLTDQLRVVYNVKHLPAIADLRLPPRPAASRRTD